MASATLFEKIKRREKKLRKIYKNRPNKFAFNNYQTSNIDIFLHYNKKFKYVQCRENCFCFKLKKISFQIKNPMSFIQNNKKNLVELISKYELHDNYLKILLDAMSGHVPRLDVKKAVSQHIKTLKNFKCFLYKKKMCDVSLFYVNNQLTKCVELYSEIVPWQYHEYVPNVIIQTCLYSHYHTIKLFECCVLKSVNKKTKK